jgi:hypothetical protein
MKIVTFTRDMRPYQAGHDAYLPDDVADRLVAAGDVENPRPWPLAPADVAPAPVDARPRQPARAQTYRTK